jgi:hypothetical protein
LLNHSISTQIRRPLRRHLRPKSQPESVQYSVSSVKNSVNFGTTPYLGWSLYLYKIRTAAQWLCTPPPTESNGAHKTPFFCLAMLTDDC